MATAGMSESGSQSRYVTPIRQHKNPAQSRGKSQVWLGWFKQSSSGCHNALRRDAALLTWQRYRTAAVLRVDHRTGDQRVIGHHLLVAKHRIFSGVSIVFGVSSYSFVNLLWTAFAFRQARITVRETTQ